MIRRPLVRELLVLLAFTCLAAVMTYPWVLHLRDAVSDLGDPYTIAWVLWWDYHQTFNNPLNLFHSNTFYPHRYTLAFSEHAYGVSLLFFPLFALGLRPLTVHSVATFTAFVFNAYAMFRLARTLTRDNFAAVVAALVFAYTPYRFGQMSHLHFLFSGWLPLLMEALVLFARKRTWRRAAWLGVAFWMNAATSVSYFLLTLVPLGGSALALLLLDRRVMRDKRFWTRGALALGIAAVALLPLLLPYRYVSELYGFVRRPEEVVEYSSGLRDWLTPQLSSRTWQDFGWQLGHERRLFPGLSPILLTLVALLGVRLAAPRPSGFRPLARRFTPRRLRALVVALDALALALGAAALMTIGFGTFRLGISEIEILRVTDSQTALLALAVVFTLRCCVATPAPLRAFAAANLLAAVRSLRPARHAEAFALGSIWAVVGFAGSFGMNFIFHRTLFEYVTLFRSMRVPARWAMVCYVGLALLAGLGAARLVETTRRLAGSRRAWREVTARCAVVLVVCAMLLDFRAAPLRIYQGEVEPDAVTLWLKKAEMRGGVVDLPVSGGAGSYAYVLRAADHKRPIVVGTSSFVPPLVGEIDALTRRRPIPTEFIDLLESIPTSFLVVHNDAIAPRQRDALDELLRRATAAARLRFIRRFDNGDDLYAVLNIEPNAASEMDMPPSSDAPPAEYVEALRCLFDEARAAGYPLYLAFKAAYGRAPNYAEFVTRMNRLQNLPASPSDDFALALTELLVREESFMRTHGHKSQTEYLDALLVNARLTLPEAERRRLIGDLEDGRESRARALRGVIANRSFYVEEFDEAFVRLLYFGYLRRDADEVGYIFWLGEVTDKLNFCEVREKFTQTSRVSVEVR